MHRLLLALPLALSAVALFPATSAAEGPGTRIRSGSQMPRVPQSPPASKDDACAPRGADRGLCIEKESQKESRETRRPVQTGSVPGPGSVSGTSGAGSSASRR